MNKLLRPKFPNTLLIFSSSLSSGIGSCLIKRIITITPECVLLPNLEGQIGALSDRTGGLRVLPMVSDLVQCRCDLKTHGPHGQDLCTIRALDSNRTHMTVQQPTLKSSLSLFRLEHKEHSTSSNELSLPGLSKLKCPDQICFNRK